MYRRPNPVETTLHATVKRLEIEGNLNSQFHQTEQSIQFQSRDGVWVLDFGKLEVFEVNSRSLPSRFTLEDAHLVMYVDTAGAVYPVIVDPVATTLAWQVESNQVGAEMDIGVAGVGGTGVVEVASALYYPGDTSQS